MKIHYFIDLTFLYYFSILHNINIDKIILQFYKHKTNNKGHDSYGVWGDNYFW